MTTYPNASTEPLEIIQHNECDAQGGLCTSRFQRLWNEIEARDAELLGLRGERATQSDEERGDDYNRTTDLVSRWYSEGGMRARLIEDIFALLASIRAEDSAERAKLEGGAAEKMRASCEAIARAHLKTEPDDEFTEGIEHAALNIAEAIAALPQPAESGATETCTCGPFAACNLCYISPGAKP